MWFDHTGRVLMLGALALQVVGAISLYRLARLR
jgi:Flp pilus assembly protein TadB